MGHNTSSTPHLRPLLFSLVSVCRTAWPCDGADGADVTAGYASALLSDVLANAPEGGVLVTLQDGREVRR